MEDFRSEFMHESFLSSVVRSAKICPDATTEIPRPVRITVTRHVPGVATATVDPLWGKFDVDTLVSVLDNLDGHGVPLWRCPKGRPQGG